MDKLAWLLPSFGDFWSQPFESQLSAAFILVLLSITIIFLLKSFQALFRANKRIEWLQSRLSKITTGIVSSGIYDLRTDAENIRNDKSVDSIGHLWLEFDETLIEISKDNDTTLYNTFDAAHFFNSSTLAHGVTDNRLIAAVPGFLTAIGVIGTFVGLQIGLSEITISSDVTIEEMKAGISAVIGGAKIAFMTSVWGVFLSVLFNFIEKLLEQGIRKKIHTLQKKVDEIFPRISPESQLQVIANNSDESRESLQGLAEQIGLKMQESMLTATRGISEALEATLNEIMAPAIKKLVNETSDGNQRALDDLLTKFMDGFGAQGQQQCVAMENASAQVHESIKGMNSTMDSFIRKMEVSHQASGQREQELVLNIENQIRSLTQGISAQSAVLTEFVNKQMTSLNHSFTTREANAAKKAELRDAALAEQTSAISTSTQELVRQIEDCIQKQQTSSEQILQQGQSLQQSVESSVLANGKATDSMKESSSELRSAADSMHIFSSHVREAGNKLSGAVSEAVETTKDLANQNQASSERMEELRAQLLSDTSKFKDLADQINNMIISAGNTFTSLKSSQSDYLQELKRNVEQLSSQMTELLSEYAEQANAQTAEHLTVWADSTTQYAESMNNAARALSGVVDEIQDKFEA